MDDNETIKKLQQKIFELESSLEKEKNSCGGTCQKNT